MRFRFKAFGLHLLASVALLTLVLGGLYFGWYYWPGWYLTRVLRVVLILVLVDAALGPALTLVIANPNKPKRELARDIAIIAAVQVVAMCFGAATLWHGRPLYYAFSADSLEVIQATDLEPADIALGQKQNPALAPRWYSLPRWIWAPLPDNEAEATAIMQSAIAGGKDITDIPSRYQPWENGFPAMRKSLSTVDALAKLLPREIQAAKARMATLGIPVQEKNALIMWGNATRVVAVFDPASLRLRTIINVN